MLTVKEAAKKLGVSSSLVYELVAGRKIGCFRPGTGRGGIRFTDEQLSTYLESCRIEPQTASLIKPKLRHLRLAALSSR
jgi:excisionase family DNA binding protein